MEGGERKMVFKIKLNNRQYELVKEYVVDRCKFYDGIVVNDQNRKTVSLNDEDNMVIVTEEYIDKFLSCADDAIIDFGMVNQDYLSPLGCELQFLYDELLYQANEQTK